MKKWTKKILAAVLCLMMLQMPAAEPLIAVQTVQASGASSDKGSQGKKRSQKRGRTILLLCEGKKSKEYMENRNCL